MRKKERGGEGEEGRRRVSPSLASSFKILKPPLLREMDAEHATQTHVTLAIQ